MIVTLMVGLSGGLLAAVLTVLLVGELEPTLSYEALLPVLLLVSLAGGAAAAAGWRAWRRRRSSRPATR